MSHNGNFTSAMKFPPTDVLQILVDWEWPQISSEIPKSKHFICFQILRKVTRVTFQNTPRKSFSKYIDLAKTLNNYLVGINMLNLYKKPEFGQSDKHVNTPLSLYPAQTSFKSEIYLRMGCYVAFQFLYNGYFALLFFWVKTIKAKSLENLLSILARQNLQISWQKRMDRWVNLWAHHTCLGIALMLKQNKKYKLFCS